MTVMKYAPLFMLLLLITSITTATIARAQPVAETYNIEFVQVNEKILVKHNVNLKERGNITINLPEDYSSLSVSLEQETEYNIDEENSIVRVSGKSIEISYITKSLIEKTDKYYFLENIKFNFNIEQLEIKLILQEGFVLDKKGTESVFPKPSSVETDGQKIIIIWQKQNIKHDEQNDLPLFVVFRSTTNDLIPLIYVLVGIVIIFVIYLFTKKRKLVSKKISRLKRKTKTVKQSKAEQIEEHLIQSEKAVIDELKKAGKQGLWQKQLQLKTGFSKAKLSRTIRNLEQRNLIKKMPLGNTNKIKLK